MPTAALAQDTAAAAAAAELSAKRRQEEAAVNAKRLEAQAAASAAQTAEWDAEVEQDVALAGELVGVLLELTAQESGERYAVLTTLPRLAVPTEHSAEVAVGELNGRRFVGPAAKAIKQQTGLVRAPPPPVPILPQLSSACSSLSELCGAHARRVHTAHCV